jgi:hypothetical protein
MELFSLAIGTGTIQQRKLTYILSTTPAVIGPCAGYKLGPAIIAQVIISLADTFSAIYAHCGPKKLIYAT